MSNCAIILAGGEGKRMKSDKPKPMSLVLGKPMLEWVIAAVKQAGVDASISASSSRSSTASRGKRAIPASCNTQTMTFTYRDNGKGEKQ